MSSFVRQVLRFPWTCLFYFAALLGAIFFAVGDDATQLLIFFFVSPALALTLIYLLFLAPSPWGRRRCLWLSGAIGLFFVTSAALFRYQQDDPNCLRSAIRWALNARQYKAAALSQARSKSGDLTPIEWDGWGFAGSGETMMYLVYDPSDSLRDAARQRTEISVRGLTCPVERVHRLETHWYTILLPTDVLLEDCMKK